MAERISNHPFSIELELAFLSSRAVRSLSNTSFTDDDRRIFGKGTEFFVKALKGIEAVETLRVTPTAAEETKIYGWGLKILSTSKLGKDIKSREEIKAVFESIDRASVRPFALNFV